MHQKGQDQPGAKVEPDRRTTAPDSRAHAVCPSPPADCTHALVKPSAAHTNMISAQNMRPPRKPEMTTVFIWSVSKLLWPTVNEHFLDAGVSEMSFFGQTRCGWPRLARGFLCRGASHTVRRRRLSAITRAPCGKVVAAQHQKDAPAAGACRGFKRHSYAVGLRPTLTIYTCWLTRTLRDPRLA